jgi:D-sedoheptulose 7-phosphate isomerase
MDLKQLVLSELNASAILIQQLAVVSSSQIVRVAELIVERLRAGNKVLVFGNGGSAADAQHFAAELVGRYRRDRQGLPALALTTDTSLLTAVGNDYGFREIFSRQVEALARQGDIAVGISTSGRSSNVIAGLRAAKKIGAYTIALLGQEYSLCAPFSDEMISIPAEETARVQEGHAVVIHVLCEIIERSLFQANGDAP